MYKCFMCFMVLISATNCRRYDVESEAIKLFGEDLNSVLTRFRKSADYLKILTNRLAVLKKHVDDIGLQAMYVYTQKLDKKVSEVLGTDNETTSTTAAENVARYIGGKKIVQGRQGEPEAKEEEEASTESPVKVLESYPKLKSPLTVAEKNSFIDIGYEFFGNVVHALIRNMGSDDSSMLSTMQAFGSKEDKNRLPSTTHASIHEVSSADRTTP